MTTVLLVKYSCHHHQDLLHFILELADDKDSFMETLGVETVYANQIILTASAREIMGAKEHLNALLETLPEDLILQVRDFAEFLQQR